MSAIDHKVTIAGAKVNDYFVVSAKLRNHGRFGGGLSSYPQTPSHVAYVQHAFACRDKMMGMSRAKRQNVTISLDPQIVVKAKILAAKRSTSISGMLAEQVEALVSQDDTRERAIASSLARLRHGLDLGGGKLASRDSLHER